QRGRRSRVRNGAAHPHRRRNSERWGGHAALRWPVRWRQALRLRARAGHGGPGRVHADQADRNPRRLRLMNFDYTDEQQQLKMEARRFLSERCPTSRVRELLGSASESYDKALWNSIAELGWHGTTIPEAYGGLGF